MAKEKKPNAGKGRRGRSPEKAEKTAFAPPPPQAEGKRSGRKKGTGDGDTRAKARRELAAAFISLEVLCSEVLRASNKWKANGVLDPDAREACAKQMHDLGNWIQSTQIQILHAQQAQLASQSHGSAGSEADELANATAEFVRAGFDAILTAMLGLVGRIHDRLMQPCTPENMEKINDDLRLLNKCVATIQELARKVRRELSDDLASGSLPSALMQSYRVLQESVRVAIADTGQWSVELMEVQQAFEASLPHRLELIQTLSGTYGRLEDELRVTLQTAREKIRRTDRSRANDLEDLLSQAAEIVIRANGFLTFVKRVWEAQCAGVDDRLRQDAHRLRDAMDALTAKQESLFGLINYYREIIARAPFRKHTRKKPLPAWSAIPKDLQDVIAVLIRLRRDDPDKEWGVATQKQVEQEMDGSLSTVTFQRRLKTLREDYEIVGRHKPIGSLDQQQPPYYFWINEDAFEKYGPEVSG